MSLRRLKLSIHEVVTPREEDGSLQFFTRVNPYSESVVLCVAHKVVYRQIVRAVYSGQVSIARDMSPAIQVLPTKIDKTCETYLCLPQTGLKDGKEALTNEKL